MQGNIDFTGSLSGSIAGGGGGGSDVTITPSLQSGTKIADYTIDDTPGVLYAPTPTSLTAQLPLSISDNVISIDLSDYATKNELSDYVTDTELSTTLEDYTTYTYTESRYTPLATFNAYTIAAESHFQRTLTAGANITIDPTTDTISASGGSSWNYSTSEVDTGQKWIDGRKIYCKVFNITSTAFLNNNAVNVTSFNDFSDIDAPIDCHGISSITSGEESVIPISFFKYNNGYYAQTSTNVYIDKLIIKYVKSV